MSAKRPSKFLTFSIRQKEATRNGWVWSNEMTQKARTAIEAVVFQYPGLSVAVVPGKPGEFTAKTRSGPAHTLQIMCVEVGK